jgi:hypothetical protein
MLQPLVWYQLVFLRTTYVRPSGLFEHLYDPKYIADIVLFILLHDQHCGAEGCARCGQRKNSAAG